MKDIVIRVQIILAMLFFGLNIAFAVESKSGNSQRTLVLDRDLQLFGPAVGEGQYRHKYFSTTVSLGDLEMNYGASCRLLINSRTDSVKAGTRLKISEDITEGQVVNDVFGAPLRRLVVRTIQASENSNSAAQSVWASISCHVTRTFPNAKATAADGGINGMFKGLVHIE